MLSSFACNSYYTSVCSRARDVADVAASIKAELRLKLVFVYVFTTGYDVINKPQLLREFPSGNA